jgi:hypothetical protein
LTENVQISLPARPTLPPLLILPSAAPATARIRRRSQREVAVEADHGAGGGKMQFVKNTPF